MQFLAIIAALLASSAFTVLAAPAPEKQSPADNCPNGWYYCGVCNGTSCRMYEFNYDCDIGKCTAQSGGGDGVPCGSNADSKVVCPGQG